MKVIEGKIVSFDKRNFSGLIESVDSKTYPFSATSFSIGLTNQISLGANVVFLLREDYEIIAAYNISKKEE